MARKKPTMRDWEKLRPGRMFCGVCDKECPVRDELVCESCGQLVCENCINVGDNQKIYCTDCIMRRNPPHKDRLSGGRADRRQPRDFDKTQLRMGAKHELEHTNDPTLAREIAMDHLAEDPKYYTKLKQVENPSAQPNLDKGLKMYNLFHDLEHKKVVQFNCKIPDKVAYVGKAVWTFYESTKWENKLIAYKHEHEAGVKFYWADDLNEGKTINTPSWILKSDVIVWLGHYLGGEYEDAEGIVDVDIGKGKKHPDLFTTCDGTALIVVDHDPTRVVALIWGGNLNVTARGIVG